MLGDTAGTNHPWWERAIIYQIYPRSFQDSGSDGVGDLRGISARLSYLVDLGVTALWISPIYPSPMADFGYDVADYCDVDPLFGTLSDFKALLAAAHASGLRVILDFVPNHSSDKHPWFLASRSARDNSQRDWYIWHDGAPEGGPPNNWLSHFGGPAWTFDSATGQYYLHSFLAAQPDLNWRNPHVRAAMFDAMRFWLDLGVDGFRVDVLWLLVKDDQFRDNPVNPAYAAGQNSRDRLLSVYDADRPETLDVVADMRALLDSYGDRLLIGEIYLPVTRLVAYYGARRPGAHLPFNFQLINAPWRADGIASIIRDYEAALPPGAWPNWVLGNHDQSRIATRVGPAQARCAALLLLTLRGTPTLYYGDELGLTDVAIPLDRIQDPAEKNQPGLGLGRDPERTPMPWDTSSSCGFTSGTPWLPIGIDNAARSVETLARTPGSMLALEKALISTRRRFSALVRGWIAEVEAEGSILHYVRQDDASKLLVAINFHDEAASLPVEVGTIVLSTGLDRIDERVAGTLSLRANEAVIIQCG